MTAEELAFEGATKLRAWFVGGEETYGVSPLYSAVIREVKQEDAGATRIDANERLAAYLHAQRPISEEMMAYMREVDARQREQGYCVEAEATIDARVELANQKEAR